MTTARVEPPRTARPGRRPELDAIRALVVVGLVFFHSALVFDAGDDYYVKNAETTSATMIATGLGVIWAMPMMFLIAGLSSWHSLRRRGPAGFAAERLRRLGVPLVFATLTIIPVPQWLRSRADPGYHESYPRFLVRFFDVRLEPSEFPFVLRGTYFEFGHLWFVVLLLVFSLLLAPLVGRLPRGLGGRVRESAATAVRRRGVVLLAAVPVAMISALLGLEQAYAAWSRWAYLLFFLYGFALASDERFRAAMRRDAPLAAAIGVVLFMIGLPEFVAAGGDPLTDMNGLAIGARAVYGAAGWCWLVAILGLLDRRRPAPASVQRDAQVPAPVPQDAPASVQDRPDGLGRQVYGYLSAAVLPLYILHQPILVAVAYGVVGWHAPIAVKYAAIVVATLTLTLAAYDLLVRRTRVTRFLFGMRARA
ncbi:acyltransferase [Sphaerisporangium sp. NPDC049003]|uniref:acyltransferase family protein n=1 Tax=Sphaerisporangium sp. NPDC049003 TaxID=3364517 RepID=UPI0037222DA2